MEFTQGPLQDAFPTETRSYTVRDIPTDQYKALRIKAAEGETSINKTILKAIKEYLKSGAER